MHSRGSSRVSVSNARTPTATTAGIPDRKISRGRGDQAAGAGSANPSSQNRADNRRGNARAAGAATPASPEIHRSFKERRVRKFK